MGYDTPKSVSFKHVPLFFLIIQMDRSFGTWLKGHTNFGKNINNVKLMKLSINLEDFELSYKYGLIFSCHNYIKYREETHFET